MDKEELVLMKVDALILGYTSTFISLLTFEVRKRKRKKRVVNEALNLCQLETYHFVSIHYNTFEY